jgi:carboxyl-terminal processing protease
VRLKLFWTKSKLNRFLYVKIDDKRAILFCPILIKSIQRNQRTGRTKKQGAERIILDVRDNPGGLLNEAVNICNLFVPKTRLLLLQNQN